MKIENIPVPNKKKIEKKTKKIVEDKLVIAEMKTKYKKVMPWKTMETTLSKLEKKETRK